MRIRHIAQLRRIGQMLRTLANQEDTDGDLDSAEMLLYLSHHVHDVADVAEDQRASGAGSRRSGMNQ